MRCFELCNFGVDNVRLWSKELILSIAVNVNSLRLSMPSPFSRYISKAPQNAFSTVYEQSSILRHRRHFRPNTQPNSSSRLHSILEHADHSIKRCCPRQITRGLTSTFSNLTTFYLIQPSISQRSLPLDLPGTVAVACTLERTQCPTRMHLNHISSTLVPNRLPCACSPCTFPKRYLA